MGISLPEPIEICLEELDDASDAEPYLRCVAVAGGCPGLCFSPAGEVIWCLNETALAEIRVSRDGRLIFFRRSPQGQVSLTRAERHLELPLGKPVIVLGGDEIRVAGRRFRVHVHGTTAEVKPPERLKLRRARNLAVAAAMALGALTADCKGSSKGGTTGRSARDAGAEVQTTPAIEVRSHPPAPPPSKPSSRKSGAVPDADATDTRHAKKLPRTPPIKVRNDPPSIY